jgi:hypothetical protein
MNKKTGFTLLESLVSLALFFVLFLGGLACFNSARSHFHGLKERYEEWEAMYAAVDKIRLDVEQAGLGILEPIRLELLPGIIVENNEAQLFSLDGSAALIEDLQPGQTRIPLSSGSWIKAGRPVCFFDRRGGESATVASSGADHIILTAPLSRGYILGETQLLVVKSVRYYLDDSSPVLRRKANTSPAQPLLEDTLSFSTTYDPVSHVLNFAVRIESKKEINHAFSIRPKNLVLAAAQ